MVEESKPKQRTKKSRQDECDNCKVFSLRGNQQTATHIIRCIRTTQQRELRPSSAALLKIHVEREIKWSSRNANHRTASSAHCRTVDASPPFCLMLEANPLVRNAEGSNSRTLTHMASGSEYLIFCIFYFYP